LADGRVAASSFRAYYTPLNKQEASRGLLGGGAYGLSTAECTPS